jgi:hypothetical protein
MGNIYRDEYFGFSAVFFALTETLIFIIASTKRILGHWLPGHVKTLLMPFTAHDCHGSSLFPYTPTAASYAYLALHAFKLDERRYYCHFAFTARCLRWPTIESI